MSYSVTAADLARYEKRLPWLKEKSEVARSVVATLPDYQQTAFRMFMSVYFGPGDMHNDKEIAQALGMTQEAVHSLNMQTLELIGKEWRRRKGITRTVHPPGQSQP